MMPIIVPADIHHHIRQRGIPRGEIGLGQLYSEADPRAENGDDQIDRQSLQAGVLQQQGGEEESKRDKTENIG